MYINFKRLAISIVVLTGLLLMGCFLPIGCGAGMLGGGGCGGSSIGSESGSCSSHSSHSGHQQSKDNKQTQIKDSEKSNKPESDDSGESSRQDRIKYWTCSMHPQIKIKPQDYKKGVTKCPICEMELVPVYNK